MRKPRLVLPKIPHHITLRGNNRRRLFSYPHEYRYFIWLVGRALNRNGQCLLHAMLLMVNHVHLCVTPLVATALAAFVKSFAQRYAQSRNKRRRGRGKLFEERFFSAPLVDEHHLAHTLSYIDLNPVRAKMVGHPEEYYWSTHNMLAGRPFDCGVPGEIITPTAWYADLAATAEGRCRAYARWVEMCQKGGLAPAHADAVLAFEDAAGPYGRRLLRPDGTSAREDVQRYHPQQTSRQKIRLLPEAK